MNMLTIFQFETETVRVLTREGEPWFVAGDLARALGYRDAEKMARNLHDDEKDTHVVGTPSEQGGAQQVTIVSESGMYAAIFKSRRPEAERFRRWVTGEVLPSIRRTGRYEQHEPPPDTPAPRQALALRCISVSEVVAQANLGRRLFGIQTARAVWIQHGFPVARGEGAAVPVDPSEIPLRQWLVGRIACTAQEAARGIGIAEPDQADRVRIGVILRELGWQQRKVRQGQITLNRWFAPAGTPWQQAPEELAA